MEYIIFDTEYSNDTLLSIACIKFCFEQNNIKIIDQYNRYYWIRDESKLNKYALKVNKLNYQKIMDHRTDNYPLYYDEDLDALIAFIGSTKYFIAHNLNADKKFLPLLNIYGFCTNEYFQSLETINECKLEKLANHYNISLDLDLVHDALYDTKITLKLVEVIVKSIGLKAFNESFTTRSCLSLYLRDLIYQIDQNNYLKKTMYFHELILSKLKLKELDYKDLNDFKLAINSFNDQSNHFPFNYFNEYILAIENNNHQINLEQFKIFLQNIAPLFNYQQLALKNKKVVLTGKFSLYKKMTLITLLTEKGCQIQPTVNKSTDIIIVGTNAINGWDKDFFGQKIEQGLKFYRSTRKLTFILEYNLENILNK